METVFPRIGSQSGRALHTYKEGFVFAQSLVTAEPGYRQSTPPHLPERPPPKSNNRFTYYKEVYSPKAKQDSKIPNYTLSYTLSDNTVWAFFHTVL